MILKRVDIKKRLEMFPQISEGIKKQRITTLESFIGGLVNASHFCKFSVTEEQLVNHEI